MAANTTPIFTLTPVIGIVQISTANTNRDGSGTLGTLVTAGADGTKIDSIEVCATGNTTNGVIRVFIHDGSNARLIKELMVPAVTPTTSVEVSRDIYIPAMPIVLPSGYSIRVSTNNAETWNVFAFGGSF